MRKILWWLLLLAAPAAAQNFTIVSATVVDPHGIPYANGTVSALLITNGVTPLLNGNPFSGSSGPANLSSTGSFTMQLASNTAIVPSTLKWQFTVCSAAGTVNPAIGTGPQCFTTLITISGATQNLSTTLSALAPALTIPVAGGSTAFSAITSGSNNSAAMTVASGASLTVPTQNAGDDSGLAASDAYVDNLLTNGETLIGPIDFTDSLGVSLVSSTGSLVVTMPSNEIFQLFYGSAAYNFSATGFSMPTAVTTGVTGGRVVLQQFPTLVAGFINGGTTFTLSSNACSATSRVGGASSGEFVSGTTGTCAVTITMGNSATATHSWHCAFADKTTPANLLSQTGTDSTTTASMTGTTVSGDLISFACTAY